MWSPIRARSNCPMATMTWKLGASAGVEVSTSSLRETQATRPRRRCLRAVTSYLTERAPCSNRRLPRRCLQEVAGSLPGLLVLPPVRVASCRLEL
jgi:hypothetical protein